MQKTIKYRNVQGAHKETRNKERVTRLNKTIIYSIP